jgi:hypothetical protein
VFFLLTSWRKRYGYLGGEWGRRQLAAGARHEDARHSSSISKPSHSSISFDHGTIEGSMSDAIAIQVCEACSIHSCRPRRFRTGSSHPGIRLAKFDRPCRRADAPFRLKDNIDSLGAMAYVSSSTVLGLSPINALVAVTHLLISDSVVLPRRRFCGDRSWTTA